MAMPQTVIQSVGFSVGLLRDFFSVDKRKKVLKKSVLKVQNPLKINDLKRVFGARDWIRTSTT
ncbi:MAG: hypothetical protein ABIY90_18660, partial [Puia sp.]